MSVTLPVTGPYTAKDQRKADAANKFIGRGSARSSTNAYATAYGSNANCGVYTSADVVFISAEGARSGRLDPDFDEIKRACEANARFITDHAGDRARPYNLGERQVSEFLLSQGYREHCPGVWSHPTTTGNRMKLKFSGNNLNFQCQHLWSLVGADGYQECLWCGEKLLHVPITVSDNTKPLRPNT